MYTYEERTTNSWMKRVKRDLKQQKAQWVDISEHHDLER